MQKGLVLQQGKIILKRGWPPIVSVDLAEIPQCTDNEPVVMHLGRHEHFVVGPVRYLAGDIAAAKRLPALEQERNRSIRVQRDAVE